MIEKDLIDNWWSDQLQAVRKGPFRWIDNQTKFVRRRPHSPDDAQEGIVFDFNKLAAPVYLSMPPDVLYPDMPVKDKLLGAYDPVLCDSCRLSELFPFYEVIFVKIYEGTDLNWFKSKYGLSPEDLNELTKRGKVVPLLPKSANLPDCFTDLFRQNCPWIGRARLVRNTMKSFSYYRASDAAPLPVEVAGDLMKEHMIPYMDIYCGFADPCKAIAPNMVAKIIDAAADVACALDPFAGMVFIERIIPLALKDERVRERLPGFARLYLLRMEDALVTPQSILNYSVSDYEITTAMQTAARRVVNTLRQQDFPFERIMWYLGSPQSAIQYHTGEAAIALKREFLVDSVGPSCNAVALAERCASSTAVKENYKILKAFNHALQAGRYSESFLEYPALIDKAIHGIRKDMKKLVATHGVVKNVVKIAGSLLGLFAGAAAGQAMGSAQLSLLFAVCGAQAASVLAGDHTEIIAEKALTLGTNRSDIVYLLWQRDRHHAE